jgi:hypothetical protein
MSGYGVFACLIGIVDHGMRLLWSALVVGEAGLLSLSRVVLGSRDRGPMAERSKRVGSEPE